MLVGVDGDINCTALWPLTGLLGSLAKAKRDRQFRLCDGGCIERRYHEPSRTVVVGRQPRKPGPTA
jgi:hypothetical protein